MPIQSKAGQPYERRFDPPARRVAPNGTQPFSAYSAFFYYQAVFGPYYPVMSSPPSSVSFEVLLFGSDFPLLLRSTEYYPESTYSATTPRTQTPVGSFNFTSSLGWNGMAIRPAVPLILPGVSALPYQKIARGVTATNGVTTAGFPVTLSTRVHNLYADDTPQSPRASFILGLESVLNSGGAVGPSSNIVGSSGAGSANLPVILYEPHFTQEVVDNGYKIDATAYLPNEGQFATTLDVVGLWNSSYVPPLAAPSSALVGAAPLSAPMSEEEFLIATAGFSRKE
jgi:hypothetical protein